MYAVYQTLKVHSAQVKPTWNSPRHTSQIFLIPEVHQPHYLDQK